MSRSRGSGAEANQTLLTGDNLVSVNGAEEDGVDNRVEAPAWVPGEGSEDSTPAKEAAETSSLTAEHGPGDTVTANGSSNGSGPNGSSSNGSQRPQPSFVPTAGPAAPPSSTSPMAVVSGAANGARGLASKVGASFTELTKTKPKAKSKPKPKSGAARKPGAGLPPKAQPAGRPQTASSRSAMLTLQRVEPMSVMKFSSLLALVMWVVIFVAVAIIYFALSKMGVFSSIEHTVGLVTSNKAVSGTNASSWFAASRVLSYTAIFCTINAVLFTALATVGAALYNLVTSLTGGVEVTLKESD
jgi:hypothetical protein